MNATIKLLDKFREVCSLPSDNACAVRLGVTRSAVSLWRLQKGHPDADSIERMCAATNEPLAKWLPLIEAERARSPAARKVWLRLAQAAAAVALTIGLTGLTSAPVRASGAGFSAHNPGAMYIMSTLRRWIRSVGTALASLAVPHGMRQCPVTAHA